MTLNIKNRYTACLLHFTISLLVFSIFILVLLTLWYPTPYFTASGGWQGLKIVAAIDLVLGPSLTLIIFNLNKPKKELIFDFSIIAFLQIAALWWGVSTVYNQRPVAAVFWEDGFYTVPASALIEQGINLDILDKYGPEKPVYIFAEKPATVKEKEEMVATILNDQLPPYQQIKLYRPIKSNFDSIYKRNLDISEIISHNSEMKKEIDDILQESGTVLENNHYVALISKYRNIILAFDQQNQLIGTASAPFKDKN